MALEAAKKAVRGSQQKTFSYIPIRKTVANNDAGLIAQTLQAAGFDVVGARDLDQDTLRRTFRDFIDKATASGPNTVALVYLNGCGFVPDDDDDEELLNTSPINHP